METHTTTLVESPASPGGLDGWKLVCETCGCVGGYSIHSMAAQYAREHKAYMETGKVR